MRPGYSSRCKWKGMIMQHSISKIGILGGTFNPIHWGHLMIAETVRDAFSLNKVLFIPSGLPPHKPDDEVIDPEHRFEMVRLSVASNPFFEASRVEIERRGYTYTVDTLRALRDQYGSGVQLFFIIGADVVPELITWREFQNVFKLCEFIAVMRPGHFRKDVDTEVEKLKEQYGIKIQQTTAPLVDISSSNIRERCSMGKSIKYLVTGDTEEYILTNGLYRSKLE